MKLTREEYDKERYDNALSKLLKCLKGQGRELISPYVSMRDVVRVRCSCGEVSLQKAYTIVRKKNPCGCPSCAKVGRSRLSQSQAIANIKNIHGSSLDLSGLQYVSAKDHVKVRCPIHGDFSILYSNLYQGQGCPKCTKWYGGDHHLLYIMLDTRTGLVKIGKSKNVKQRLYFLRKYKPDLIVCATFTFGDGTHASLSKLENAVHRHFKEYNAGLSGFDGATEYFNLTPKQVEGHLLSLGAIMR